MMENGQPPDPKRPRIELGPGSGQLPPPSSWSSHPQSRELPAPASAPPYQQHGPPYARQPDPQTNPLDAHRRHSAHTEHQPYDTDPRRPASGPPPHVFHQSGPQPPPQQPPYGGQQSVMFKREPEDAGQYRPNSTGSAPEHNATPTQEGRYHPSLPPPTFEHQTLPQHSGPQPYRPTYQPTQSPMPGSEPYGQPGYGPQRADSYVTYPSPVAANTQKRKAQRAAQACDSCRTLKAKCDEGRPSCASCREKGIPCIYRDPPPKQQDKSNADVMDALTRIQSIQSSLEDQQSSLQDQQRSLQDQLQDQLQNRLQNIISSAVSDAISTHYEGISREFKHLSNRVAVVENAMPQITSGVEKQFKEEPEETKTTSPAQHQPLPASTQTSGGAAPQQYQTIESPFVPSAAQKPAQEESYAIVDTVESAEEEEDGPPVAPGQPAIPVNHTTGAARLLLVRPISELAQDYIKRDRIKNEKYPMLQEERRGLLRLYGRGEGTERLPGYDKDPLTDSEPTNALTPSETGSEVATPPGEEWGQLGGLTPPGDQKHIQRGLINEEGMPDLDPTTVQELVESYKEHINNMHPILVPRHLDSLVRSFIKSLEKDQPKPRAVSNLAQPQSSIASFIVNRNPDSPGNKRKRSPVMDDSPLPAQPTLPNIADFYKPGHPFRSIGSAIVLLVMALGKICLKKERLPDCVPDRLDHSAGGSPKPRNGHPSSPLQSSPGMSSLSTLPSPADGDKSQSKSRRTSIDEPHSADSPRKTARNLDVIPGLPYFCLATDIIGNQAGGNSLQHVHANILASLYHGQLGRPLESHAFLHQACRSLQVILRPKLDRFKRLNAEYAILPAKDNPLVFAFWTCLQLESDIVAELPVPHSGILTYEQDMPGPNLQAAKDADGFTDLVIESYGAQLYMRKHLNSVHNMFYKPAGDSEYPSVFNAKSLHNFPTIDQSLAHLESLGRVAPNMKWEDDDEPANDILRARLRAKYYGAKVITYRHALLRILEHSYTRNPPKPRLHPAQSTSDKTPEEWFEELMPGIDYDMSIDKNATRMEDIHPRIHEYAKNCIKALIKSTTAFHGLGDPGKQRLIVTNIWGTAHAQWGNLLTLQAAYMDPILGPLIDKKELKDLYEKTIAFLKLHAQPSSALTIDWKILEHVAQKIKLIPPKQGQASGSSFSSITSGGVGDVPMAGY